MMKKTAGFTLIEVMIVIIIIGVLAAIAMPRFASLVRKADEGATKGNLGALKSALSVYYNEMEGWFPVPAASGAASVPDSLGALLTMENGKYLQAIPDAYCPPYHGKIPAVTIAVSSADESSTPGAWGYKSQNDGIGKPWGVIWVNCTHTDSTATTWGTY
jgi:prepilin-type N-terminal cleavage/methylation domain-containing protein